MVSQRSSKVQVARNLGKTLREFQPTIRELQVGHETLVLLVSLLGSFALLDSSPLFFSSMKEVSREFKSTLEREIGLDEMPSSTQTTLKRNSPYISNSIPTPSPVTNTEESGTKADPSE